MRDVPLAARDLVKQFEGLRLKAYLCPAGKWTIGYGHTDNVRSGQALTVQDAGFLLTRDLELYAAAVEALVLVPLTDNQFAALISFVFNVGVDAFRRSTLLRLLNAGEYDSVPAQLHRWVHAGTIKLPGLVKRRAAEAEMWVRV